MVSRQEIESIRRSKKRFRTAIILSAVFLFLVAAAIVSTIFINKYLDSLEGSVPTLPEIIEGEAIHGSSAIAYPSMEEKDIVRISIKNKNNTYTLLRSKELGNSFVLYYEDEKGEMQVYYPPITEEDSSFNYNDIYAEDTTNNYGIPKLTYLCVALEYAYFSERIPLSENEQERNIQLREYGLRPDEIQTISFDYLEKDAEGKEKSVTRQVKIGAKNITGNGYYFMIDDRDYAYSTTSTYYDYALMSFYSYLGNVLVAAGLPEDNAFEPYLTTDYKQWKNELHKTEGEAVTDSSKVIVFADMLVPLESKDPMKLSDGYIRDGYKDLTFDLSKYKGKENYRRLLTALSGAKVGKYFDTEDPLANPKEQIFFTLTTDSKAIAFGDAESKKYTYTVTAIESVITDEREYFNTADIPTGTVFDLVKITYILAVDGVTVSETPYHAVVDLNNKLIPEPVVNSLRTESIGELSVPISFDITYTKENATARKIEYVITEIMTVYDQDGKKVEKVGDDTIVTYHYRLRVDGVMGEEEYSTAINLKTDESENGKKLKDLLRDKKASKKLEIIADSYTEYCEAMLDFVSYNVAEVKYFVTSELIVSFRFQNNTDRDPFYGESIYENTMDNKYGIYGLNSKMCETVVKILGGIGEETTKSEGLSGLETVAVGITPYVMEKYGLYAHTVYFELPRGITVIDSGDADTIDDYSWYETLGFTLHISEEQPDGTRFVGSEMYDIVAKVKAEDFVFLKYDFVDFWARDNLILTDIAAMKNLTLEMFMEDRKGSYSFDLDHRTLYYTSDGKGHFKEPESYTDTFDFITVNVTPSGECTSNKFMDYISAKAKPSDTLENLYKDLVGGGKDIYISTDTYGTAYFKEVIEMLYNTKYTGVLSEEEQAAAFDGAPMVMRFSVKLDSSAFRYVYEFYRISDRRVMVSIYQADSEGNKKTVPVSDFYLSTYAFKKIVSGFWSLLNAEEIDTDAGYVE